MSELQRVVDALARVTHRAVAIHDQQGRILAYSSHEGPVDEVRTKSILTRKTSRPAYNWARTLGIEKAKEPMRIPANREFGMDARICCPVRFDERLLGLLWLVDADESLPDQAMSEVEAAANSAALAIEHEHLIEQLERGKERELLRDLLSEQVDIRTHAAEELIGSNILVSTDCIVALVVRPVKERAGMTLKDRSLRTAIERALASVRRTLSPHQALHLVRPDHGLLLVCARLREVREGGEIERTGNLLHEEAIKALGQQSWNAVVGIGDAQKELTDAYVTYRRARQSAEVCGLVESFGDVAAWWQLGVYQTLVELSVSTLTEDSLHHGLIRLLQTREPDLWLRTLECYLDLGCDARATAKTLNLQRGSLYYRLRRMEELAGVDLRKGDDRLALHLGIKLARLAGLIDMRPTVSKPNGSTTASSAKVLRAGSKR